MFRKSSTTLLGVAALLTLALAPVGCGGLFDSGETISASGQLVTESYDFTGFSDVEASSAFDVEIESGDAFAVEVTVDDNIVEFLDVNRSGDALRIGLKGSNSYRNPTLQAQVTMPTLDRIKLTGASSAAADAFSSDDRFEVDVSGASSVRCSNIVSGSATFKLQGASSVECRDLETGDVSADLEGASRIDLTGSGQDADLKAQGASKISMGDLTVADANVELSGASEAAINVSGALDVDLAGSSDLTYVGEPQIGEVQMAGDSTMERR